MEILQKRGRNVRLALDRTGIPTIRLEQIDYATIIILICD